MNADELRFADSAEGLHALAVARRNYELMHRDQTFTEAMERQAVRDAMAKQARQAVAAEALKQSAYVRTLDEMNARKLRDDARDARFK